MYYYAGDLNVAHLDLDIYNYEAKHIVKQAGLTPQERASFTTLLTGDASSSSSSSTAITTAAADASAAASNGPVWVDALRYFYPEAKGAFTYWSKRTGAYATNSGLRLDYFLCSPQLFEATEAAGTEVNSSSGTNNAVRIHDYVSLHEYEVASASDHGPIALIVRCK